MKILGLDFETTGTNTAIDRVIEVGYVQWDIDRKTPLQLGDFLVKHPDSDNVVVSAKITEITHITPEDIQACGMPLEAAFEPMINAMNQSDYVVAHNGERFDRPLFQAEIKRLGWEGRVKNIPWIDTLTDVPYDSSITRKTLGNLAEHHGVKNLHDHRAVFDVLTMLEILAKYDFASVVALAKVPNILIQAKVSFDTKDQAKARSFYWEPESKRWLKRIKECALDQERTLCGFEIVALESSN